MVGRIRIRTHIPLTEIIHPGQTLDLWNICVLQGRFNQAATGHWGILSKGSTYRYFINLLNEVFRQK